jgi:hypothetical protein
MTELGMPAVVPNGSCPCDDGDHDDHLPQIMNCAARAGRRGQAAEDRAVGDRAKERIDADLMPDFCRRPNLVARIVSVAKFRSPLPQTESQPKRHHCGLTDPGDDRAHSRADAVRRQCDAEAHGEREERVADRYGHELVADPQSPPLKYASNEGVDAGADTERYKSCDDRAVGERPSDGRWPFSTLRRHTRNFIMSHEGMAGLRAAMDDASALIRSLDDSEWNIPSALNLV